MGRLGHQRGFGSRLEDVEGRVLVHPRDLGEQVDVEVATDHRRRAQHALGVRAQARHPAADDLVHARRELDRGELGRPRPASLAVALDRARFGEVADHLAEEEGVPARLAVQLAGERRAALVQVVPRRGLEQALRLALAQAREHEAFDARLAAQVAEQLGQRSRPRPGRVPIGGDHEQRRRGHRDLQVLEERQGRPRGPVDVVEDQEHRRLGGGLVQELHGGPEQQVALGLGVGRPGRGHVVEARPQPGDEPGQLAAMGTHVLVQQLVRSDLDQMPERLAPGLIRHARVGVAAPVEHGRASAARLMRQLAGQARLADAGLTADQDQAPLAVARLRPRRAQPLALGDPAHEPGGRDVAEPRREGRGPRLRRQALPPHAPRRDLLRQALQLERADRLHGRDVGARGEQADRLGDQDLAALRGLAQARRLHHGGAEPVPGLGHGVAHRDADLDLQRRRGAAVAVVDALLHPDRAGDGRGHAVERGHHAVAEVLDLLAAAVRDRLAEDAEVLAPQRIGGVGPQTRRVGRRSDEVREDEAYGLGRTQGISLGSGRAI